MTTVETPAGQLTTQQLNMLLQYTVEAYKTFEKLAENLPNPLAAEMFKQFAVDEREHRDLIDMKMATSEAGKAAYELGMEIVGPMAPVTDPSFADTNRWSHGFFMSFANTIAGGSSEIQRNIIAQRVLGLPRA